jgi:hypothetical protein
MSIERNARYYCPRCHKLQWFLSWKPLFTNKWRCRNCGQVMTIDAQAIGGVWAWSIGFWSMPIVWPLTSIFCAFAAFLGPRRDMPVMLIGGAICFGPMFAFAGFFLFAIVGFIIGLVYGQKFADL